MGAGTLAGELGAAGFGVCDFPPLGSTGDWHVRTHMSFLFCLFLHYVGVTGEKEKTLMKRWEGKQCVMLTRLLVPVAMAGSEDGARAVESGDSEGTGGLVPLLCPEEDLGVQ